MKSVSQKKHSKKPFLKEFTTYTRCISTHRRTKICFEARNENTSGQAIRSLKRIKKGSLYVLKLTEFFDEILELKMPIWTRIQGGKPMRIHGDLCGSGS